MSTNGKDTSPAESQQVLLGLLIERYGAVIGGRDLRTLLGFRSTTAFGQSVRRGDMPIRFFKLPRRRGYFALATEIAAWSQASAAKSVAPADSPHPTEMEDAKM